jgi:hypothetical protein
VEENPCIVLLDKTTGPINRAVISRIACSVNDGCGGDFDKLRIAQAVQLTFRATEGGPPPGVTEVTHRA